MDINVTDGGLDNLMLRSGDWNSDVNVNGQVGSVMLFDGDLAGSLLVADDIERLLLLKGSITGVVRSDATIESVMAADIDRAEISALVGIGRISVFNDLRDSVIAVGVGSEAYSHSRPAAQVEAYLGTLSVAGTFSGSTVAVGVAPDEQGDFINGTASAAAGTIGSVSFNRVELDNQDSLFGLVARDAIDRVRVNNQAVQGSFQLDDFFVGTLAG